MKTNVYNQSGESVSTVELSARIFENRKLQPAALHLVVTALLGNLRRSTAKTKTRGQVSGGGKKPWKQKGTGRARAGSSRSPLWRGGGVTFGPDARQNYGKKVNRKTKRLGIFAVLSDRAQEGRVLIMEGLDLNEGKTKELLAKLKKFETLAKGKKFLIVLPQRQEKLERAARNLANVKLALASNLNILDLLWAENILILKDALPNLEKTYAHA